jgi:hypothetical protein
MAKKEPSNIDSYELPKAVPMEAPMVKKNVVESSQLERILDEAKSADTVGLGYELAYTVERFAEARKSFLLRLTDLAVDADEEMEKKIDAIKASLR